ncbi:MAG: hypothetical protein II943_07310 [Victivallales bacterium]|nr:hypothetical protein [Victivallales bacterium]
MKKIYFLFALIALLAFAPACSHHHHHHHSSGFQEKPLMNPSYHPHKPIKPGHHGKPRPR